MVVHLFLALTIKAVRRSEKLYNVVHVQNYARSLARRVTMWLSIRNYWYVSKWSSISFWRRQCPSDGDFSFPRFVGLLILSLWKWSFPLLFLSHWPGDCIVDRTNIWHNIQSIVQLPIQCSFTFKGAVMNIRRDSICVVFQYITKCYCKVLDMR
jgi:hypothetical protein